ncbi:MAG: YdbC family protein [Acetivibrio ethanolgignens]
MAAIEHKIIEHIGVLGERGNWNMEVNLISWNEGPVKYDIRTWNEDHTKCGKGATLTPEEWVSLREVMNNV